MTVNRPRLLLTFVAMVILSRTEGMKIMKAYRDVCGDSLLRTDMDVSSGTIILSSGRTVARLNENLDLKEIVHLNKSTSNVHNFVADFKSNTVILCSSVSGTCAIHSLKELQKVLFSSSDYLVSKNSESLTEILLIPTLEKMFIANGFLGSEYGLDAPLPVLSIRSSNDLNLLHHSANTSAKYAQTKTLPKDYFVTYLYSFCESQHVYFITQQSSPKTKTVTSRISRLCLVDNDFRSYVEIQLDCVADASTQYSVAQAAYFDESSQLIYVAFTKKMKLEERSTRLETTDSSAVCSFELQDIDKVMDQTVRNCYQGTGNLGPVHLHKPVPCPKKNVKPDLCGQSESSEDYPAIEGTVPLFRRPVITFPTTVVTSIVTRTEAQHSALYLGTLNGFLKKVTVADNGLVTMASDIYLDLDHRVMAPMFLNLEGDYLYAATQSKLMKIDVDHCQEKTSCRECTSTLDSVCGWCVQQNKCTKEKHCHPEDVSPAWLPSRNGVCAGMRDVFPSSVSVPTLNRNNKLSFKLDRLTVPNPSDLELHCSFVVMDTRHKTQATLIADKVTCPLPERTKFPNFPDHGVLQVEFQIQGRTVVKRDVSLYNCQLNQNCTCCTNSQYGCKWCHVRGLCVESTEPDCINQSAAAITTASECPRLEISSHDTDVVVHSGQTKKIAVRVANLQADQLDNVLCLFTYDGDVKFIPGMISGSNLICDPLKFEFADANLPIVTAAFTVTAGKNSLPLDNPQNIRVRIYKCGPMVTNCGQCLSMDSEYECGWCTAGIAQCALQSDCPAANWLDRSATCPDPQILRFRPLTGPIQGKTNVSVSGLNLGKTYKDLEVIVAGQPCVVQSYDYEASQGFVCQVMGPDKEKDGIIKVKVADQYTARSNGHFSFVDPIVTAVSPKKGPVSGGTRITIMGKDMDAGTMTTLDVGGSPCRVSSSNETSLTCVTSQLLANENSVYVEVDFAGLKKLLPEKFTYMKDPEITMIEPKITILSGGTSITAMGNQMQFIQSPQFFVEHGSRQITTDCILEPVTGWLKCTTPRLAFPEKNITETNPVEVHYGFNLDGVTTYRNISRDAQFGPLLYYPDPDVKILPAPVNGGKKYQKDDTLVIKGNFRLINPMMQDVHVTVGGAACVKPSATDNALSCSAPESPLEIDNKGNAAVLLQIGNMREEIGYIKYYATEDKDKPIAVGIILGVVLPIIAIVTLLAICVIRRHRKHKPSEDYIPDVWKEEQKDEEMQLNHVVQADMNGSIPDDKDTAPYIEELLSKVADDHIRQNIQQMLISRKKLNIGDMLAKGNFGVTYKATYSQKEEENPKDVVVKTLQGSQSDSESVASFLQSVSQLRDLSHPSVVPILGVCITVSDDPMIIVPFSQYRDVKSYVRDSNKDLKVAELLDFGHQIAEAMDYLSSQTVVHGNLALRNCLLNEQKQVMVADFGLHQNLFTKEQYQRETDKNKCLLKWLAPEVIEAEDFNALTTHSDVWSYGVVLWELLTRGVTPYPDVDNSDLPKHVKDGNRMKKPKQCPEDVYALMLRCWTFERELRPSFRQIADELLILTSASTEESNTSEQAPLQSTAADDHLV